jgi:PAS domain S-box-containing protein
MARRARQTVRTQAAARRAAGEAVDFHAVIDSIGDVVFVLDLEGRFTYLNPRAYEVFGYDRAAGEEFVGRPFMDVLAPDPDSVGIAVARIRHRHDAPHDRQLYRIVALHKDGSRLPFEIHGAPLWRDGRMVGRVGVCRLLDETARSDGATPRAAHAQAVQEDRMRIARGLRDAIAQVVFGLTADRDAGESFLADVKRASRADLARRLRLDDVDLEVLRSIAAGASNREIASQVHLSPATVKDRVRRLMERLGAHRRAELAAHALRLGIA